MTETPPESPQPVTLEEAHRVALDHHQAGRLDKAEAVYRQIVVHAPDFPDAHHMLGVALHQTGRNDEALPSLRRAVELAPDNVAYRGNLGVITLAAGLAKEAIEILQVVVEHNPQDFSAHYNLGNAFKSDGQLPLAATSYKSALDLNPGHAESHVNLGTLLRDQGDLVEAGRHFQQALEIRPDYADAHSNLGATLVDLGQFADAEIHCNRAVELAPEFVDARYNLGNALRWQFKLDGAIKQYRHALRLMPELGTAHNNLAMAMGSQGHLKQAIEEYRHAVDLSPEDSKFHSNLLQTLQYDGSLDAEELFDAARQWAAVHASALDKDGTSFENSREPDRKLKIGYVSPDFRQHSVAYFAQALMRPSDPGQFEVTCYYNNTYGDQVTDEFRSAAHRWREIASMDDQAVCDLIAGDEIDILVDLAGHTMKNRATFFAHKPAPVLVTYLGYAGTTGLEVMDYRLTDQWADPDGAGEEGYTEQLIRLDGGFLCYTPAANTPDVGPSPATAAGHITFGSFNNLSKITPDVVGLWARVLGAVAGSRLLLKNNAFADPGARARLEKLFQEQGIDSDRIELLAAVPDSHGHLSLYNRVDIGLDTFPYNGTTTTVEAMWMGVPTITLAGDRHAARVGSSLCHTVGLEELIAHTDDDYVSAATTLASDLSRLGGLRADLRDRVRNSRLMDTDGFNRTLEDAYRQMWRTWCAS